MRETRTLHGSPSYSRLTLSAAAPATAATTALTSVSATRIRNGGRNGCGSVTAAAAALTPKISTGIVKGRTSTAIRMPPRPKAAASAAPTVPASVSAGVPTSSVSVVAAERQRFEAEEQAEEGRGDGERQAGGEPMTQGLGKHDQFHRLAGEKMKVEGTVVAVVLEEAVEAEQRREQRADPEDRRSDPRQQVEVRPDRERDDGDDGEEEHQPDQRAAAAAESKPRSLARDRGKGGDHGVVPSVSVAEGATGSGRWVAAMTMPPPARCAAISPPSIASAAASSAVAGSSRSQTGRAETSSRASATRRFCPAERRPAGRSIRWARPTWSSAVSTSPVAAVEPPPVAEVVGDAERRLQRVEMAEIVNRAGNSRLRLRIDPDRARRWLEKPGDDAKQGRLARAIRPGNGEHLAARHRKADAR